MAVNAAHLTRTLSEKPSIFEVLAQESLHATIRPALRKLIRFLRLCDPKTAPLERRFDELYLLLDAALQYYYLRNRAASFSEHFYGLRRVPRGDRPFAEGLSTRDERLSLLFLTLVPYLARKLDRRGRESEETLSRAERISVALNRASGSLYRGVRLVALLAYMSGRSRAHSPALALAGLSLVRAGDTTAADGRTWADFWNSVVRGEARSAKVSFEMVGAALLRCLEIGAFFVQFAKWWDDRGPSADAETARVPQFPDRDVRAEVYVGRCPICFGSWKTPCVLPVSGYVCCYACAAERLGKGEGCPVTRYGAREEDLIRIYL